MSAFVRNALDDAANRALEEHIDVCELCRGGLAAIVRGSAIASHLGRYRLGRLIGAGGMGIVYEALDPELGREVAIKVVRSRGSDDDTRDQRIRLAQEARTLASIRHPNVCQVLDVGSEGDEVWVAMELVRGVSLRMWLTTEPSRSDVIATLTQLARGLEAVHRAGVCHGDVKPDNVLVEPGRAVVTDFGLARIVTGDESLATSSPGGTPGYLAPEQLAGQPGDARSDQYAWCLVAAQALGARSAGFEAILRRGQARDPDARFPSMSALLAALDRVHLRRRVTIAIGGLAAIAAIATTTGLAIGRRGTEGEPCGDLPRRLAGVWDTTVRTSLQDALIDGGRPDWEASFASITATLDARAAAWIDQATASCKTTHIAHTQSLPVFELREGCLERALAEQRGILAVLAARLDLDRVVVQLLGLPSLERCENIATLTAENIGRALPDELPLAREIDELSTRATLHVDHAADRARAEALLARTPPISDYQRARVHMAIAEGHAHELRVFEQIAALEAAQASAIRAVAPAMIAAIATELVLRRLQLDGNYDHARGQLPLLEIMIAQAGDDAGLRARFEEIRGVIVGGAGDRRAAIVHLERAVALQTSRHGVAGLPTLDAKAALADALAADDQLGAAELVVEQVLADRTRILGGTHPEVGVTLLDLAAIHRRTDRLADAARITDRALEILTRSWPADDPRLALPYLRRGEVAYRQQRFAEAERDYRRVLALVDDARAAARGDDLDLQAYDRLGHLEAEQQRWDAALTWYDRALAVAVTRRGRQPMFVPRIQASRCFLLFTLGRGAEAEQACEATISEYAGTAALPDERAEATFTAAQVLAEVGRRDRARALAKEARAAYQALGKPDVVREIDTLLETLARPR